MIPTRPARIFHRPLFSFLALVLLGSFVSYVQATEQPTFSQCRVHIEAAIKATGGDVAEPSLETAVPADEIASPPPTASEEPAVLTEDPAPEVPAEELTVPEEATPEAVEEPVVEEVQPAEVAESEAVPEPEEEVALQEEPAAEDAPAVSEAEEEPAAGAEEEATEESADAEAVAEPAEEEGEEVARDRRSVDEEIADHAQDDSTAPRGDEPELVGSGESDDNDQEVEQQQDDNEEGEEAEAHDNDQDDSQESEDESDEASSEEEPAVDVAAEETQPKPELEPEPQQPEPEPEPEPAAEPEPVPEPVKQAPSSKQKREIPVETPPPVVEAVPAEPEQTAENAPQAEAAPAAPAEPEPEAQPAEEPAPEVVEDPAEGTIDEAPEVKRSRNHFDDILQLEKDTEGGMLRNNAVLVTLKEVKRIVETAVRPLETIYKYKDVSNRQFGDPEVFSKPMVLFLGPWSAGKSSIVNYLLGTEYTKNALKTGAEPSATFFQILMFGDSEEALSGTQLAADWTFSGLQKYGQAFIDRLRGKRLPNKLLEKVNIVEVPGILEVRKQVDRPYPFNDVVQWFIDRADLIFVVYDPTKLDTGLEHEALFDQLKGRQNQVRVLLNKADSVTQEELLLIQNNLVWNLSPLMASPLPPTVYAGSFWSRPYKPDAPVRLLRAHEENMLQDIRDAIDNVVENTIAEARRHAVRVRNHAKMVDCYLTTYYNHKGFFGNKKKIADEIVDNPHQYHIFEGLSTLSNISRYDLPDAEVYRDFFRIHNLYEFKALSATCTFFRGCPLDKLDTAIAYELPELIGKYKKRIQQIPKKPAGASKS